MFSKAVGNAFACGCSLAGEFSHLFVAPVSTGCRRDRVGQLLWLWNSLFFVGALIYLGQQILTPDERVAVFLGKAVCPECQTMYVRPWLGINRIGKRYERCPQCKHYHWKTLYAENSGQ